MPNPFPGMNPYLENPAYWRGIHADLIITLRNAINAHLPSPFVTTIEERVYMALPNQYTFPDLALLERRTPQEWKDAAGSTATLTADAPFVAVMPDEEVFERYIAIRAIDDGERVVAVVEVLSPTNKARESYGQDAYAKKRDLFVQSNAHFVEIDLLRDGLYTVSVPRQMVVKEAGEDWDYIACLHPATPLRNVFEFWPTSLRSRLPRISIPLLAGFSDIVVDLQTCVNHVYDAGLLERRIDYAREPVPPLSPDDAAWADALLKTAGFR